MKKLYHYHNELGRIALAEKDGYLTDFIFGGVTDASDFTIEEMPLLRQAATQLEEYLSCLRKTFDIPLRAEGSDFEKKCGRLSATFLTARPDRTARWPFASATLRPPGP